VLPRINNEYGKVAMRAYFDAGEWVVSKGLDLIKNSKMNSSIKAPGKGPGEKPEL